MYLIKTLNWNLFSFSISNRNEFFEKLNFSSRKCYLACAMLIFPFLAFTQTEKSYDVNQKFEKKQLIEDCEFLANAIKNYHPAAFQFTRLSTFDSVFTNYIKSLPDSLTEREFRNELYAITEVIKCGHAGISSSKARQKYFKKKPVRLIPLELYCIDSQIVVVKHLAKDTTIQIGAKVTSIDGIATKDILQKMFLSNSSDGYNLTNRFYAFERSVQFEYIRYFPEKDTFTLSFLDKTGNEITKKMAAIVSDSLPLPNQLNSNTIYSNKQNRFYLSKEDSSVAVLDLLVERMMGYKKFYRKSFKYLKQNNIEKLVLDLRGNGGGFMLNPGDLLSYLLPYSDFVEVKRNKNIELPKYIFKGKKWVYFTEHFFHWMPHVTKVKNENDLYWLKISFKPKKKRQYEGKLVVLTDGGTFSAASFIAAFIKKYNRGTIVGNETGGGEAGCSAFLMPQIELPNTKLQYRLPLYQIKHNTQPKLFGRGVFPDFKVKKSLEDILQHKDKEMEMAIEILNECG